MAPDILSLPVEVESIVFSHLTVADLAACVATCRAWRASAAAPALWHAACQRRWLHGWRGGAGVWRHLQQLLDEQRWHELYAARRRIDADLLALLERLQWPEHQHSARRDAQRLASFPLLQDALHESVAATEGLRRQPGSGVAAPGWPAAAEWGDVAAAAQRAPCSLAYWAKRVQEELLVSHCARRLEALGKLAEGAAAELARRRVESQLQAAAVAAPPAADAAAAMAAAPAGPPQPSLADAVAAATAMLQQQQDAATPTAGLQQQSDAQLRLLLALCFEQGALALAAVHRPFADLGWVETALDAMGAELRRRMAAAGVQGGLPALQLLNTLLFGRGPSPRHPRFSSIPPPDPHGLEIVGNRAAYFEPTNSLLDHVLSNREGIPISLAVLHAAVGTRAGLDIQLLGLPMHVVTAMEVPEAAPDGGGAAPSALRRVFVDVFDGGQIMDAAQFDDFLQGLGLAGQHAHDTQAMSPRQCWLRMSRNLVHIHREQQDHALLRAVSLVMSAAADEGSAEGVRATVEAVNASLALQQFHNAAELLRQITGGPYEMQLHGGGAAGLPSLPPTALEAMQVEIQAAADAHTAAQMTVRRRDGPAAAAVAFRVGQVLRHRSYAYRGVIVGWDPQCRASEDWMASMGVHRLQGGRHQPFFHVLPDPEDRPGQMQTYVAMENVELEPLPALHSVKPGYTLHPEAGRYFSELAADGASYRLTDWMRRCYPDD